MNRIDVETAVTLQLRFKREEQQMGRTAPSRDDTPLGQWAIETNRWEGIDRACQAPTTFSPPNNLQKSRSQRVSIGTIEFPLNNENPFLEALLDAKQQTS